MKNLTFTTAILFLIAFSCSVLAVILPNAKIALADEGYYQGEPVTFTFKTTVSLAGNSVPTPGVEEGDILTLTVVANNGRSGIMSEYWDASDIISSTVEVGSYKAFFKPGVAYNDTVYEFQTDSSGKLIHANVRDFGSRDTIGGLFLPDLSISSLGVSNATDLDFSNPASDPGAWTITAGAVYEALLIDDSFDTDVGQWEVERAELALLPLEQNDFYLNIANRVSKISGIKHDVKGLVNPNGHYQLIADIYVPDTADNEALTAQINYKADGLYVYKTVNIGKANLIPGQWTTVNFIFQMPNLSQIDKNFLKLSGISANVDFSVNNLILKKYNYIPPQPPKEEYLLLNDTGEETTWKGARSTVEGDVNTTLDPNDPHHIAHFHSYLDYKFVRNLTQTIEGLKGNTDYVLSMNLTHFRGYVYSDDYEKVRISIQYKKSGVYVYKYLTIADQQLFVGSTGHYIYEFSTPDAEILKADLVISTKSGQFSLAMDDILLWEADSDTDGDGVTDTNDMCPDTPIIEFANSIGCSLSQLTP